MCLEHVLDILLEEFVQADTLLVFHKENSCWKKFDSNTNYLKHLVAWFIAAEYNFHYSFCPEETECIDFFPLIYVIYSHVFPLEKFL